MFYKYLSSLIADSIEILDINGQRIFGPVVKTMSLSYSVISSPNMVYICRVNSTLGSQSTLLTLDSTTNPNLDTSSK